jgi:hypothetical protein
MRRGAISRMDGDLGGWKLEDQPAVARVDMRVPQYVAEEHTVGFRVVAVDDDMCSSDRHWRYRIRPSRPGPRARDRSVAFALARGIRRLEDECDRPRHARFPRFGGLSPPSSRCSRLRASRSRVITLCYGGFASHRGPFHRTEARLSVLGPDAEPVARRRVFTGRCHWLRASTRISAARNWLSARSRVRPAAVSSYRRPNASRWLPAARRARSNAARDAGSPPRRGGCRTRTEARHGAPRPRPRTRPAQVRRRLPFTKV